MTKFFLASLVGAIIMYVWSFLAWVVLPVHDTSFIYTPAQDAILKALSDNNLETGIYAMPSAPTKEEREKVHKENAGKPAAAIFYEKEMPGMGAAMHIWGFVFNFIMIFAACMLLAKNMAGSFFSRWWMVMMVAVVIIFGVHLMNWNWMHYSWNYTRDYILDTAVGWGLCGLWLAWYMGKR